MSCRAGAPESWTLEPQAVLWCITLQNPVPGRTSACVSLTEICGAPVRFPWRWILSKCRTWSCMQLYHRSYPPHTLTPKPMEPFWNSFIGFGLFVPPAFHSLATVTKMCSDVYIIFTKPWIIAPYLFMANKWENVELLRGVLNIIYILPLPKSFFAFEAVTPWSPEIIQTAPKSNLAT